MLDLKKLENELDEVLKSETTESLAKWLMKKRNVNYPAGEMDILVSSSGEYNPVVSRNVSFVIGDQNSNCDYSLAA